MYLLYPAVMEFQWFYISPKYTKPFSVGLVLSSYPRTEHRSILRCTKVSVVQYKYARQFLFLNHYLFLILAGGLIL